MWWYILTLLMLDKENPKVSKAEWKEYNKKVLLMCLIAALILFFTVLYFYEQ